MRLESESRTGLEMDLKRLKFEFNPVSADRKIIPELLKTTRNSCET